MVIGTDHNINLIGSSSDARDFLYLLISFNFFCAVNEPTRFLFCGDSSLDTFLTKLDCWNYYASVCDNLIADLRHVQMVVRYHAGDLIMGPTLKLVKFRVFNETSYGVFTDYLLAHVAVWYEPVLFLPIDEAFDVFFDKFVKSFECFFLKEQN